MEYYNGIWCISTRELFDSGIVSESNYRNWVNRKRVEVVKRGGGAKGSVALVAVDSLPQRFKEKVAVIFPDAKQVQVEDWVKSNYIYDQKAAAFFGSPKKCGLTLEPDKVREYVTNASVINTCIKLHDNAGESQRLFGGRYKWEEMTVAIEALRKHFGHTLPSSVLRFRKKVNEYRTNGYGSLISGKFGNQCARLLTKKEETILDGIVTLENKPWNKNVHDMYEMFVCGELDVWNPETGELLNPEYYAREKDGDLWVPSETTISNYLNKPSTKFKINRLLKPRMDYYHEDMPHVHRHNGSYSLSQITMDDVDLSRRMHGDEIVHAYYAYDMVSQCVLGASYSKGKGKDLVEDCFREMFHLIKVRKWGLPLGVEVENHLMTRYKEGLLKDGVVFTKVRFCAPQNSQDKYAESLNGSKKRSIIHKNHENIGRFYGKGKWKVYYEKASDETNQKWLSKKYYTFDELVADDRADNLEWNNSLHPDQDRYPGMTRWEVLIANINPGLRPYDELLIARYLGVEVSTSIRRNSYVRACHRDWWLSSPEILEKLDPNNYKVTAYYLPDSSTGMPENVYIFQNGKYIDTLEPIETFNRIVTEQTDEDREKFGRQMKKINAFKAYIEKNAVTRLGVMKREPVATAEAAEAVPAIEEPAEVEAEAYDAEEYNSGDFAAAGRSAV